MIQNLQMLPAQVLKISPMEGRDRVKQDKRKEPR